MSGEFLASNGVLLDAYGYAKPHTGSSGMHAVHEARREYYQHLRDQELGRWRWPENPDYVVYPIEVAGHTGSDYRECAVLDESTGLLQEYGSDLPICHGGQSREAARAYFAAHPEPKPLPSEPHTAWVDKYGTDIWWVDGLGKLRCCASPGSDPRKYAPFTRLVPEVSDD